MQIFGSYQRLEYSGLSLQLNLSDHVFKVGLGDSYLAKLGYDRFHPNDLDRDMFYSYNGASHIEGPAYPIPLKFVWDLQYLTPDKYELLMAIVRRSRADKAPVRLCDRLLKYGEVAPRTRAMVGTAVETIHGLDWYFPQFDIWLELPNGQEIRELGRYYLRLEGREWNPATPVPITEDVAA